MRWCLLHTKRWWTSIWHGYYSRNLKLRVPLLFYFVFQALVALVVATILAVFTGFTRNKSDASNNLARLCGIVSVVLLFSSGILIAGSLYAAIGAANATGYSFTLMAIAQFLSFLSALLVAHWMVNEKAFLAEFLI